MQLIILVDFAINFDIHRIYTFHTQTISILFSNLYELSTSAQKAQTNATNAV